MAIVKLEEYLLEGGVRKKQIPSHCNICGGEVVYNDKVYSCTNCGAYADGDESGTDEILRNERMRKGCQFVFNELIFTVLDQVGVYQNNQLVEWLANELGVPLSESLPPNMTIESLEKAYRLLTGIRGKVPNVAPDGKVLGFIPVPKEYKLHSVNRKLEHYSNNGSNNHYAFGKLDDVADYLASAVPQCGILPFPEVNFRYVVKPFKPVELDFSDPSGLLYRCGKHYCEDAPTTFTISEKYMSETELCLTAEYRDGSGYKTLEFVKAQDDSYEPPVIVIRRDAPHDEVAKAIQSLMAEVALPFVSEFEINAFVLACAMNHL